MPTDPTCDAPANDLTIRAPRAVPLVLLALAMGGFAIGVTEFASMSVLPDFAADLGVDTPTAGHAISAYALGVVVGAPVLAVLGAKVARWKLLIGFMALVGAALAFGGLITWAWAMWDAKRRA